MTKTIYSGQVDVDFDCGMVVVADFDAHIALWEAHDGDPASGYVRKMVEWEVYNVDNIKVSPKGHPEYEWQGLSDEALSTISQVIGEHVEEYCKDNAEDLL